MVDVIVAKGVFVIVGVGVIVGVLVTVAGITFPKAQR